MSATYTINTKNLSLEAIQAIKDRFGDVDLAISVQRSSGNLHLSETECWAFIDRLEWEAADDKAICQPLVEALAERPVELIEQFADWLSEKLWLLDTPAHAKAYLGERTYLSVDDFLYVRCAIVANGQAFYENILAKPEQLTDEVTFEALLYLPQAAYKLKTGEEMNHIPLFNFETYGNKAAWERT